MFVERFLLKGGFQKTISLLRFFLFFGGCGFITDVGGGLGWRGCWGAIVVCLYTIGGFCSTGTVAVIARFLLSDPL